VPTTQNTARTWERNQSRHETRRARTQPVTPEQVCYPAAAQAIELRRLVVERGQKKESPPLLLLTSAPPARWNARALLKARRDDWGIESTFHQRLDETLDADRSRVRPPNAAHALGLFRRLVVSVGHAWLERARQQNARASLRTFVTGLRTHNARRALDLVTTCAPQAWKQS
jgi:hypothetical protein